VNRANETLGTESLDSAQKDLIRRFTRSPVRRLPIIRCLRYAHAVFRVTVRPSPIGPLTLAARGELLVMVRFGDEREHAERFLHRQEPSAAIVEHRDPAGASAALDYYFNGDLAALDRLQIEFYGTDFQRRVWTALRAIGAGRTASYLDIANTIGAPSAVRAVGAANGANPIPIVVPCHRIIGNSGALVGYGGGLDRKRWLLEHEGVLLKM